MCLFGKNPGFGAIGLLADQWEANGVEVESDIGSTSVCLEKPKEEAERRAIRDQYLRLPQFGLLGLTVEPV